MEEVLKQGGSGLGSRPWGKGAQEEEQVDS